MTFHLSNIYSHTESDSLICVCRPNSELYTYTSVCGVCMCVSRPRTMSAAHSPVTHTHNGCHLPSQLVLLHVISVCIDLRYVTLHEHAAWQSETIVILIGYKLMLFEIFN